MDPPRTRANLSVSAHDIDLSESGKWVSAVMPSLGKDPGTIRGYLDGTSGMAEADARIGIGRGAIDIQGSVRSARIDVRGIPLAASRRRANTRTDGGGALVGAGGREARRRRRPVSAEAPTGGRAEASARVSGLRISQAALPAEAERPTGARRGSSTPGSRRFKVPTGWEIPRLTAESKELSVGGARFADVRVEGTLGAETGTVFRPDRPPPGCRSRAISGGEGNGATDFSLSVSGLPTSFLLAAAGRTGADAEGMWSRRRPRGWSTWRSCSREARSLRIRSPSFAPRFVPKGPAAGHGALPGIRVSGTRQGDGIAGELLTEGPETRLAWEVSLREPFDFRLQGPFSIGDPLNGRPTDDKRRVSVARERPDRRRASRPRTGRRGRCGSIP